MLGKWVDGLQSTPDVNHIIEYVEQRLAVVRHRQGEDLELVPAVLGEADDEAHGVALRLREHVLGELFLRTNLQSANPTDGCSILKGSLHNQTDIRSKLYFTGSNSSVYARP